MGQKLRVERGKGRGRMGRRGAPDVQADDGRSALVGSRKCRLAECSLVRTFNVLNVLYVVHLQ